MFPSSNHTVSERVVPVEGATLFVSWDDRLRFKLDIDNDGVSCHYTRSGERSFQTLVE